MNKLALVVVVSILLVIGVVVQIQHVSAAPFYTTGTHKIVALVKFDSDCWKEIYGRATPKNSNQDVLNKQTVRNNDKPDNGPSEMVKLSWKFKTTKFDATKSTNEGKIRMYVTIEFPDESFGPTVTKYKEFNAGKMTLDFGIFNMKTNKDLCA